MPKDSRRSRASREKAAATRRQQQNAIKRYEADRAARQDEFPVEKDKGPEIVVNGESVGHGVEGMLSALPRMVPESTTPSYAPCEDGEAAILRRAIGQHRDAIKALEAEKALILRDELNDANETLWAEIASPEPEEGA